MGGTRHHRTHHLGGGRPARVAGRKGTAFLGFFIFSLFFSRPRSSLRTSWTIGVGWQPLSRRRAAVGEAGGWGQRRQEGGSR